MDDLQEASLVKNLAGGGGCGCGCLGLLIALVGFVLMGAVPLGLAEASGAGAAWAAGIGALVAGALLFGLGAVVYVISLVLD